MSWRGVPKSTDRIDILASLRGLGVSELNRVSHTRGSLLHFAAKYNDGACAQYLLDRTDFDQVSFYAKNEAQSFGTVLHSAVTAVDHYMQKQGYIRYPLTHPSLSAWE